MKNNLLKFLKEHWFGLIFCILATEIVGFLSSIFSGNISETINSLSVPPLLPPSAVFPIVWSILYALMGIAVCVAFVCSVTKMQKIVTVVIYILQLSLNFVWSIIFFNLQLFGIGVVIIMVLITLVSFMMAYYYNTNKWSGLMILPYILWLTIALYLACGIFILN